MMRDLSYYYASVRDARAVEETIVPMLDGQGVFSLVYMIPKQVSVMVQMKIMADWQTSLLLK